MDRDAVELVVLAAGRGSRLGALGAEVPKWLLEVGGRPIAARHLEGAARAAVPVARVRVVTGHGEAAVARFLATRSPGDPPVELVHNPDYATRNNWYSLLVGLRGIDTARAVVVLNADLLLDPAWVASFLEDAVSGAADGLLAVDTERPLTDEAMKVSLGAAGTLSRIGKVGVPDAVGEYVGMLSLRGDLRAAVHERLEGFEQDPAAANEWYEGAIARTLDAGAAWHLWPMPGSAWAEIDDDDDLRAAVDLATP